MERFDLFLVTFAAAVLGACIFLIVDEYYFFPVGPTVESSAQIGVVTQTTRDVRRRHRGELPWQSVSQRASIHAADSVFTGENSAAEIRFQDGQTLSLESNTLITLLRQEDQDALELLNGKISGTLGARGKILLVAHGQVTQLKGPGARVEVQSNPDGTLALKILAGEAEILQDQKPIRLRTNEEFRIEPSPAPLPALAPQLVAPVNGQSFILKSAGISVPFLWKGAEAGTEYEIEISRDATFSESSLIRREKSENPNWDWNPTEAGTVYWRVRRTAPTPSPFSEPMSLEIRKKPKLAPPSITNPDSEFDLSWIFPESDESLFVKAWNTLLPSAIAEEPRGNEPTLRWSAIEGATGYEVEISDSPQFNKIILRENTVIPHWKWRKTKPGTYYWRVRGIDDEGMPGEFSAAATVRIRILPPLTDPVEPILITVSSPEEMSIPGKAQLSWKPRSVSSHFEIQLSRDPGFTRAASHFTPNTHLEVPLPEPGEFYWRVRSVDERGAPLGIFSPKSSFIYEKNLFVSPEISPSAPSGSEQVRTPAFSATLSATVLNYSETAMPQTYSAVLLTPELRYASPWPIPSVASIFHAFYTVASFAPSMTGVGARRYGADADIVREFSLANYGWQGEYGLGYFWQGLSSTGDAFGFGNAYGPQLNAAFGKGPARIRADLRFTSDQGVPQPSNQEWSVSLLWRQREWLAEFKYARLQFKVQEVLAIYANGWTLGIGKSW